MKIIKKKYRDSQHKKQLYKRLAAMKKQRWANNHHLQHQDHFKYHFKQHQDQNSDQIKSNPNKGEDNLLQKVRNRIAAESSRQKKRYYVEDLQKKVMEYEELLQTKICINCHKRLCQNQEVQLRDEDSHIFRKSGQYFEQNMIRIENKDSYSPFGLFFVICLLVTIAVFSYGDGGKTNQKRILINKYELLAKELTQMKNDKNEMPPFLQSKIDKYIALLSAKIDLNANHLNQQVSPIIQAEQSIQPSQSNSSLPLKQFALDSDNNQCLNPSYTVTQLQLPQDQYFFKVSLFQDEDNLLETSIISPKFKHNQLKLSNWQKMNIQICLENKRMMI